MLSSEVSDRLPAEGRSAPLAGPGFRFGIHPSQMTNELRSMVPRYGVAYGHYVFTALRAQCSETGCGTAGHLVEELRGSLISKLDFRCPPHIEYGQSIVSFCEWHKSQQSDPILLRGQSDVQATAFAWSPDTVLCLSCSGLARACGKSLRDANLGT